MPGIFGKRTLKTYDYQLNLRQLRLCLVVGSVLVAVFIFADLKIIPSSLIDAYIFNRLGIQIPAALLLIVVSFWRYFDRIRHSALFMLFVTLTFANYALIVRCWLLEGFSFPYEGTLLYTWFAFFILRLDFIYAFAYVLVVTLGFAFLVMNFPIYGDRTMVSLGFVFISQAVGLAGVYALDRTFKAAREANDSLVKLSEKDYLTDLLNRGAFDESFKMMLSHAQRANESISVFMIDIDHFKLYNDEYGHQQGDKVIQQQANILKAVFKRDSDCIARYGGEEFVVVASDVTSDQAESLAEKVLACWDEAALPQIIDGVTRRVSCSIGVCTTDISHNYSCDALLAHADEALYQAKHEGRARFVSSAMDSSVVTPVVSS